MPGIVPIVNYSAIEKFANKCGTKIPNLISKKFLNANESSIKNNDLCINIAVNQIVALLENGIKEFHLYSLNHIQLIEKIWITAINNY
jgi:methylenetetrahydrofolate reductase (NADPH)